MCLLAGMQTQVQIRNCSSGVLLNARPYRMRPKSAASSLFAGVVETFYLSNVPNEGLSTWPARARRLNVSNVQAPDEEFVHNNILLVTKGGFVVLSGRMLTLAAHLSRYACCRRVK